MRQWWNKLPMYDKEGQSGRPLVVFDPHDFIHSGTRKKPHQEEPDLDDDDDPPAKPPKKKAKQPEFETVEIGGKKYQVEKGAAAELQKLTGKGSRTNVTEEARLRAMFEDLLDQRIPKKGKKKAAEPEPDDDDDDLDDSEMFTDPKAYRKKLTDKLTKQIMNQVQGAYSADQGQRTFWQNFYSKNEDLQDYDFIVKAVLNENLDELRVMEVREASKKLGEYVREKLLEIAKKTGKGKAKPGGHVEGSGAARISAGDSGEEDDQDEADRKAGMPLTLGGMLKLRREKRRKPSISEGEE